MILVLEDNCVHLNIIAMVVNPTCFISGLEKYGVSLSASVCEISVTNGIECTPTILGRCQGFIIRYRCGDARLQLKN